VSGWIGVDFDGTLAEYGTWVSGTHCGKPIGAMLFRVKKWLADGREVRIFTARIHPIDRCVMPDDILPPAVDLGGILSRDEVAILAVAAIRAWCREHIGQVLPITNVKDYGMIELWDDRAVQVRANTGEIVGHSTRGLD
jgi:hypothetical protein